MKALVLDFDGVISDSAREAFVVARRTWLALCPGSSLGEADPSRLYAGFLALMPLGNRAEDYGAALAALERGVRIPDQARYDSFRAGQDEEWLREFHRRFYAERARFAAEDPWGWRRLLAPYPRFLAVLRRRAGEVSYAIATSKDGDSLRILLQHYGVDDLFPARSLHDKETGVSKTAHLEQVQSELGLEFAELTFVDDKVNHLDAVAGLGVRCALAAWGYNGPREHALARERGHLVCTLDDVEERLFGRRDP